MNIEEGELDGPIDALAWVISVAKQPGNKHAIGSFGTTSEWFVDCLAEDRRVDVNGYRFVLDTSAVRHIWKEHGNHESETARGQIAVTEGDLLRIPLVLMAPDRIVTGAKNRMGRDQVAWLKVFTERIVLVWGEIRTGRKQIAIVSMRGYPPAMNADKILSTLDPNARSNRGNSLKIVHIR